MHKKPPIAVIVIVIIAVLIGGYYGLKALSADGDDQLTVSGTIEAIMITISPEMPGRVVEVFIEEGAPVKKGDPLFRMDDSLLKAQQILAESGLVSAQAAVSSAEAAWQTARANYDLAFIAARVEAVSTRTSDWIPANLDGYSLPGGYFSAQELMDASALEVSRAKADRDNAMDALNNQLAEPVARDFNAVEKDLLEARLAEQTALDVLNRARLASNQDLIDDAQAVYDEALTATSASQDAYDELVDSEIGQEILSLRMAFSIQQERYESAQDRLLKLQVGEASPKLKAALAALSQAELAVNQSRALVAQAEAQLDLLEVQIGKLTIYSPADGSIMTRKIQPGEIVTAGSSALTLGILDELTIVVYVPEDIYGTLFLNQHALLTVDSFPGETFQGQISWIADQAEFTPRNVQTVEGRKGTVFAIKLVVIDSGGKLKPGMAADVTFDQ